MHRENICTATGTLFLTHTQSDPAVDTRGNAAARFHFQTWLVPPHLTGVSPLGLPLVYGCLANMVGVYMADTPLLPDNSIKHSY